MDVDTLAEKIRRIILSSSNHKLEDATNEEFYFAFCRTLRDEIMIHANAAIAAMQDKKARTLNFLSMEYLPGRLLSNNIANLGEIDLVKGVLKKMNRKLSDLITLEREPGLGNGGLGRLASCFLDSLATLHYPARAYGLRYQYGIFEQEIRDGKQIERPDCWLLYTDPWELRRDSFATNIHFDGEEVRAIPYDMPILGRSSTALLLRLWSTKESPRNFELQKYNAGFLGQASENTSLTDVLYPNEDTELGKRVRLKQEFLLVAASLHDIFRRHLNLYGDFKNFRDKVRIQINDTHPALIIPEIIRHLTEKFGFTWCSAWETCQEVCSYTNHTVLREALEEWNRRRIAELLPRQHAVIEKLNQQFCDFIRTTSDENMVKKLSIIEDGQIRMSHLAYYGSHKVNGVAKLHTQILKETLFHDLDTLLPDRLVNITNGVTHRRWLLYANPLLSSFITQRIGDSWITNFRDIANLHEHATTGAAEFLEIKRQNKLLFKNQDLLFDVQVKRFHDYKRQLMNVLHIMMRAQEGKLDRLWIFGGKAAPNYHSAKQTILLINTMAKTMPILFIENYNVTKAETLIPAADLSEQISAAGWEASGTGNMKLAINGALTIGTKDGANIEMEEAIGPYWPFSFGSTAAENRDSYNPRAIYDTDPQIRSAVDALLTFGPFQELHNMLIHHDPFRILKDLRAYYETQKKVDALYKEPLKWAETAIHNIASMGAFSTDESIRNYAEKIWDIVPNPPDKKFLELFTSKS